MRVLGLSRPDARGRSLPRLQEGRKVSEVRPMRVLLRRLQEMTAKERAAVQAVRELLLELPGGIDEDAREDDASPEDMTSHIGGLAVKRLDTILAGKPTEWKIKKPPLRP
jgi:hypothetical protein